MYMLKRLNNCIVDFKGKLLISINLCINIKLLLISLILIHQFRKTGEMKTLNQCNSDIREVQCLKEKTTMCVFWKV